jgi:hypothetical protein
VTVVGRTTVINVFPYHRFEVPLRVPASTQVRAPRRVVSGVDVTEQRRGAS